MSRLLSLMSRLLDWCLRQCVLSVALFGGVLTQSVEALVHEEEPFDPRRIPVELQAWWTPNFGHIHAGARLPLGQEVSGVLEFDVRIVLHNNPGELYGLSIHDDNGVLLKIPLEESCPYDGVDGNVCAFNVPVSLDTNVMQDGWRELRIRAQTLTPDGQKFLNSSGVPINVQNGKSDNDKTFNNFCDNRGLVGRGWYTEFGYVNSVIECVPQTPISGTHTFQVRAQQDSSHLNVALDRTHLVPAVAPWPVQAPSAGQILFDEDGDFDSFIPITIDTSQLEDGWHTLAVTSTGTEGGISLCEFCDGEINHLSGVSKIWFYVQNENVGANLSPFVKAGTDHTVDILDGANLRAYIADDGVALGPEGLTVAWALVDGPGTVAFGSSSAAETTASFSVPGLYRLRVTAADAEFSVSDEVEVTVLPPASSIVLEEVQTGGSSDTLSVSTTSPVLGVIGDLYLAAVSTKSHREVIQVSGLGLDWQPVRAQCGGRGATGISVWGATGNGITTGGVTAFFDDDPRNAVIAVSRYSRPDGPLSVGAVASVNTNGQGSLCDGGSDSDSYALSIETALDGGVVYRAAAMRSQSHVVGEDFELQTEVHHGTSGGSIAGLAIHDLRVRDAGAVDADGAFSGTVDWAVIAVELKPEEGEAPPPPPVNLAPTVDAGSDQTVDIVAGAVLNGVATDDGLPAEPGVVTTVWSHTSGPGTVVFADSNALSTSVQFSASGSYTLELLASDGELSTSDALEITVTTTPDPDPDPAPDPDPEPNPDPNAVVRLVETQTGGSSDSSVVGTTGALAAVGGHLYVASVATKSHRAVIDVVGLGLEWWEVASQCAGRNQTGVSVWAAMGAPTHSGTVEAILENAPRNAVIAVARYDGVHAGVPFTFLHSSNTNGDQGACGDGRDSKQYRATLTTANASSLVFSAVAMRHRDHLPGSESVERVEIHHGASSGATAGLAIQETPALGASQEVIGDFNRNVDWAIVALELHPAETGTPAPVNQAPVVDVGGDLSVSFGSVAFMDGSVVDDGYPTDPGTVTASWSQLAGPGEVSFSDPSKLDAVASFSDPGLYQLQLSANDGELSASDDLTVTVLAPSDEPLVAFPGAVGFGRFATGGRGGDVYTVTSLNDSGSGSLREFVENRVGPRTIVFAVSGYIDLLSEVSIRTPDVTIAGQTSPGGITLRGARLKLRAGNVIVRGMRFRPGDDPVGQEARNRDGWSIGDNDATVSHVVFDHCSATWAQDENGSNYYLSDYITIQRCLFAEGLPASDGAPNGFGYLLVTAPNTTLYQNAFFSNSDRNPKVRSENVEVINNLGYNWRASGLGVSDQLSSVVHAINNYYVHGPDSLNRPAFYLNPNGAGSESIYLSGNVDSRFRPEVGLGDEWDVAHGYDPAMRSEWPVFQSSGVQAVPTMKVPGVVLAQVGALNPTRDAIDERILSTLSSNTGTFVLTPSEVGGYPTVENVPAPLDSDSDGMPDLWEDEQGLNPNDPTDRNLIAASGYTQIEVYINGLIPAGGGSSAAQTLSIQEVQVSVATEVQRGDAGLSIRSDRGVNQLVIQFPTSAGIPFQLQQSDDLKEWKAMHRWVMGDGEMHTFQVPIQSVWSRFFRVRTHTVGPLER